MSDERKKFEAPKPVTVGDVVNVVIEGQGGQGDGIAKVEGFVIFVKGVRKGEKCMVKITDVKRTYAVGEKAGSTAADEREAEMEDKVEGEKDGPAG